MSLSEMAELYSAATGRETSVDDLKEAALRQITLEKAFNPRHTAFGRQDDMPTPRDLNEPIPTGRLAGWKTPKADAFHLLQTARRPLDGAVSLLLPQYSEDYASG